MNPTHLPCLMILSLHTQDACLKLWRGCRLTQRWEASLWLAGKQMYLGGFQDEDNAGRAAWGTQEGCLTETLARMQADPEVGGVAVAGGQADVSGRLPGRGRGPARAA